MAATSKLLLPRKALAGCVFAVIVRDTRGAVLSEAQRFNHFPASPLVALTCVFAGETRLVPVGQGLDDAQPVGRFTVTGPQNHPTTSWNPGPVFALTIGFYPEAWQALTGTPAVSLVGVAVAPVPDPLRGLLAGIDEVDDIATFWATFQDMLEPLWQVASAGGDTAAGSHRLVDWSRHMIARAAVSGPGRSLRSVERRVRGWTGQSPQSLAFFASIETLHGLTVHARPASLAALAHDAGYADQSHMGRAVRRATGFSPARLNRLIARDEAFWCYRLLGERF